MLFLVFVPEFELTFFHNKRPLTPSICVTLCSNSIAEKEMSGPGAPKIPSDQSLVKSPLVGPNVNLLRLNAAPV